MTWNEFKQILQTSDGRLHDRKRSLTFSELAEEAEAFGDSLQNRLGRFEPAIGLLGRNSVQYLVTLFGVLTSGRIPVLLNTRLNEHERSLVLKQTGASFVIELDDENEKTDSQQERSDSSQSCSIIICSSGSEGKVKAASLSLDSFVRHARAVNRHLGVSNSDHWLACLPFYHVGGLTIPIRCALTGADVTILESAEPVALNDAIESNRITLISMVATSLEKLLDLRRDKPFPEYLRAIITGGGPVPSHLLDRCPVVYKTYRMTESGSMLVCARPGCDDAERYSAGAILPDTEIRIADDDGKECEQGQEGNVLAKGPGIFDFYVNDEERTANTFSGDWLKTGDYGYLDKNGNLNILARRTDLILSGGENILPAEIENALKEHPDIANALVLPIEDDTWGQVPGAVIVCPSINPPSEETLRTFLKERLASYKLPKRFLFIKNLPMLSTGKVDLVAIRELLSD